MKIHKKEPTAFYLLVLIIADNICYIEDPFGIIFEVSSHSYEVTYFEGAY